MQVRWWNIKQFSIWNIFYGLWMWILRNNYPFLLSLPFVHQLIVSSVNEADSFSLCSPWYLNIMLRIHICLINSCHLWFHPLKKDTLFAKCLKNRFNDGSVVKNLPANAGDRVPTLIWEDPTWPGATKLMCHNCWDCALQLGSCSCWSPCTLEPVPHNRRCHCKWESHAPQVEISLLSPQLEKSPRTTQTS